LEGLFEYLLNRVDYEDKQAVNLLYDCYMFCMREKGGLAEIKKLLERSDMKPVPLKQEAAAAVPVPEVPAKPQLAYPEPEEQMEKKAAGSSYVGWLTEKLFPWKKREPVLVAEDREEYVTEPPVAVPAECLEEYDRTVLLSAIKKPEVPELICEQTGEVVFLTKVPFYLGSAGEYADFVPVAEGVSRIHCCISKKENNYYLSDLNSTNGTYLNGKEVPPGKDALLSANDEIRVCSQEFYIKFPCH